METVICHCCRYMKLRDTCAEETGQKALRCERQVGLFRRLYHCRLTLSVKPDLRWQGCAGVSVKHSPVPAGTCAPGTPLGKNDLIIKLIFLNMLEAAIIISLVAWPGIDALLEKFINSRASTNIMFRFGCSASQEPSIRILRGMAPTMTLHFARMLSRLHPLLCSFA